MRPCVAIPAAKVTACCSEIPASKVLFGNFSNINFSELPVGVIIVFKDQIITRVHNLIQLLNDVTARAEMRIFTAAADLLDVFVTALNNKFDGNPSNFDDLVLNLLPDEYKTETVNLYDRILQVCSYVARISDSYAIRMHKKLTGNII